MNITVADLKRHMRLDLEDTSDDDFLAEKIAAAEGWIEGFLGVALSTFGATPPAPVREALRQMAAHFYENREATAFGAVNEIPFGAVSLLAPFRTYSF